MTKLRLDADALRVESFPAAADTLPGRGTVKAHEPFTAYGRDTCWPNYTCPECATPPAI